MIKDDKGIKIEEWAEEFITDIRRFSNYWNAQQKVNSAEYPEHMSKGDWDEQFNFYTQNPESEGLMMIKQCEHGGLARSCPICERDETISLQRRHIQVLQDRLEKYLLIIVMEACVIGVMVVRGVWR